MSCPDAVRKTSVCDYCSHTLVSLYVVIIKQLAT